MKISSISEQQDYCGGNGLYDAMFFASGYETRATHVAKHVFEDVQRESAHVFAFEEQRGRSLRKQNDKFFTDNGLTLGLTSKRDARSVFAQLARSLDPNSERPRILVDYSSMTTLWFASILAWMRYQHFKAVEIDFAYSPSSYEEEADSMVVEDCSVLPGFAGNTLGREFSTACFSLGFEGLAAEHALELLEPDEYYCMLGRSGKALIDEKVQDENESVLAHASALATFGSTEVASAFRGLSELLFEANARGSLTLVPLGPKPHVLAMLLYAFRHRNTTVLRVGGRGAKQVDAKPLGPISVTKVTLES